MPKLVNSLESISAGRLAIKSQWRSSDISDSPKAKADIVHRLRKTVNCQLSTVNCQRGFSLIEILIAISVASILGIIGFSSLRGTQASARDAQRKIDLQAIATALDLYYQQNGRFPRTEDTSDIHTRWDDSDDSERWIDDSPATAPNLPLSKSYIKNMPIDPKNISTPLNLYEYKSNNSPACPQAGQWYALVTWLEDADDPDTLKNKQPGELMWCNGSTDIKAEWGSTNPNSYWIVFPKP